uniref:Transmembrane protein n=1 Tax=Macrostomum lignano TaxID=282301 RepID=A0A1I8FGQ4_9PLAT
SCNYRWLQSCNYRWLQVLHRPIQFAATSVRRLPQKAAGGSSYSHGSQTEARQTSSAMPASDSEPQRQVVYEPCVRPSELLRRQRLPTEASAEQPPAAGPRLGSLSLLRCWRRSFICMLFLFVKLSFCSHRSTPVGGISAKAAAVTAVAVCHLGCIRSLAASAAAAPAAAACADSRGRAAVCCRACSHRCLLRPSRHPLRRRRDQRRRQEALCGSDSPGRPRARRRGFYNGFRVAWRAAAAPAVCSLAAPCCSTACCFCPVLAGSRRCSRRTGWQFLKFFEGLPEKERILARIQSALKSAAAARGRVSSGPRPVEAGAPAGAHQALPIFSGLGCALSAHRKRPSASSRTNSSEPNTPPVSVGLRLVNTPSQTVLLPASEASSLPVRAAASAALLTILSADRTAAPQQPPEVPSAATYRFTWRCSALSFTWHCSALSFTWHCSALRLHLALLFSSFTWHCSALSFTWHCLLLSASPGTALLFSFTWHCSCSQLHLALLCSQLHLALHCLLSAFTCTALLSASPGQLSALAAQLHLACSFSCSASLALLCSQLHCLALPCSSSPVATVAPAVAVPAARSRLALALRSGSACPAAAKLELRSAERALMSSASLSCSPADVGPDDARVRLSGVLAGPSLRGPDEGLVLKG